MPIFVFRSEKDRRQLAFAADEEGKALPAHLGPWCRTSNRAVPTFVGMPDSFQATVAMHGHVLIQIGRKSDRPVRAFRVRTDAA